MSSSSPSTILAAQLPDIGDGLAAALRALQTDSDPRRCELMAIQLDGARRHCLRLAEAIRQEGKSVPVALRPAPGLQIQQQGGSP